MMRFYAGPRDRCCTPWHWLVRLLFAFLLAASLVPRAAAQTELGVPNADQSRECGAMMVVDGGRTVPTPTD